MSERSLIAEEIGSKCREFELNEVYGVDVGLAKANGKAYYNVTFCIARILDGCVKVYSPKYIVVKWQTQFRDMPNFGQEKFESKEAALEFIKTSFVRGTRGKEAA